MITATRYHDISCGHRVYGHESKCSQLHGHNYRFWFTVEGQRDGVGRVMDFSVIKEKLCYWLEDNWDHKFLLWEKDPWLVDLEALDPTVVRCSFNPTAENMAEYLVKTIAPPILNGTGVTLIKCTIEETRKCSASYNL